MRPARSLVEPADTNARHLGRGEAMDRRIETRFWTWQRVVALVFVGIGIVGFYGFSRRLSTPSVNVDLRRLTISTVDRAPFQEFTPIMGNVLPSKIFYLETVEGGRVEEIYEEEGNLVWRGTAILRLANTDLQLAIMNRQDQLMEQANLLVNTRLLFEQQDHDYQRRLAEMKHAVLRQRRLYERDISLKQEELISQIDYELSQAEYEFLQEQQEREIEREKSSRRFREGQIKQLERTVERMRERLSVASEKFEKLTLRAPADGQLTSLDAEIGQSKAPGERIGQVDVLDDFKVRSKVDQIYISRIDLGQSAAFDLMEKTYWLTIDKIYPEVQEGKFEIDLRFTDSPPREIKRGQTLHIRLMLGELSESIVVGVGPFFQKTGGQWVYIVDPTGQFATRKPVRLGRKNTEYFEVLDGLTPGDRVVTSAYDNFGNYEKLVLKE